MSLDVSILVWSRELPGTEKLVLLKLADCAHHDGTEARPTVGRIMAECGIGRRTAMRTIRKLQGAGLITQTKKHDAKAKKPAHYRVNLSAVEALPVAYRPEYGGEQVSQRHPLENEVDETTGARAAPVSPEQGPERHSTGARAAPEQGPERHPEQSLITVLEQPERKSPAKKASKRVSKLEDLSLDDELRAWGREKFPEVDLDAELGGFVDYCLSHDKTYKDYRAGFRTRVRNARKFSGNNRNSASSAPNDFKSPDAAHFTAEQWRSRVSKFRETGQWSDGWSGKPGQSGCIVPASVLAEFGFNPDIRVVQA